MYPVTLVTLPTRGATYFVTSLWSAVAVSVFVPGVVTPNVVASVTAIVIGELVVETPVVVGHLQRRLVRARRSRT